jgi:hypothetical protein
MADIFGPKIEVNIQFQVPAVVFPDAVKAKCCSVTLGKEHGGRQLFQLSSAVI